MKSRWYKDIFRNLYRIRNLENIKTFYDIGANVGAFSVYVRCLFPFSKIIAIEPINNPTLKANSKIFDFKIIEAVIGNGKDVFLEESSRSLDNRFLDNESPNCTKKFKSHRLADFIPEQSINSYMIKIDIEGAEKHLINDPTSEKILFNARQVSMEVHFGKKFNIDWQIYDNWIRKLFIVHNILYYKSR